MSSLFLFLCASLSCLISHLFLRNIKHGISMKEVSRDIIFIISKIGEISSQASTDKKFQSVADLSVAVIDSFSFYFGNKFLQNKHVLLTTTLLLFRWVLDFRIQSFPGQLCPHSLLLFMSLSPCFLSKSMLLQNIMASLQARTGREKQRYEGQLRLVAG